MALKKRWTVGREWGGAVARAGVALQSAAHSGFTIETCTTVAVFADCEVGTVGEAASLLVDASTASLGAGVDFEDGKIREGASVLVDASKTSLRLEGGEIISVGEVDFSRMTGSLDGGAATRAM
jgi:hypothetical protein